MFRFVIVVTLLVIACSKKVNRLFKGEDCVDRVRELFYDEIEITVIKNVGCFISVEEDELPQTTNFILKTMADAEEDDQEVVVFANSPYYWHLDQLYKDMDDDFVTMSDGVGVDIYVLDTGVTPDHVEFASGQVVVGQSFINEKPDTDNHGHGTHCSSLAAGQTVGVSPGSTIIGVKVLSSRGSGTTSGVIKGISWAIDHAENERNATMNVMSMSLGGGKSIMMNTILEQLSLDPKWIITVAAGNSNMDAEMFSPASARESVLTIGANDRSYNKASFSNWGSPVDLWAPGLYIYGATLNNNYIYLSGTSMATPIVAGVAASIAGVGNLTSSQVLDKMFEIAMERISFDENEFYQTTKLLAQTFGYFEDPPNETTNAPTPLIIPRTHQPSLIIPQLVHLSLRRPRNQNQRNHRKHIPERTSCVHLSVSAKGRTLHHIAH